MALRPLACIRKLRACNDGLTVLDSIFECRDKRDSSEREKMVCGCEGTNAEVLISFAAAAKLCI